MKVSIENIAEVYTKYEIGRYIVEDEQYGKHKAGYGKQVIINSMTSKQHYNISQLYKNKHSMERKSAITQAGWTVSRNS